MARPTPEFRRCLACFFAARLPKGYSLRCREINNEPVLTVFRSNGWLHWFFSAFFFLVFGLGWVSPGTGVHGWLMISAGGGLGLLGLGAAYRRWRLDAEGYASRHATWPWLYHHAKPACIVVKYWWNSFWDVGEFRAFVRDGQTAVGLLDQREDDCFGLPSLIDRVALVALWFDIPVEWVDVPDEAMADLAPVLEFYREKLGFDLRTRFLFHATLSEQENRECLQ